MDRAAWGRVAWYAGLAVLLTVLSGLLRLLHPLMPFVTEEVFSYLPGQENRSCMLSSWPEADASLEFPEACARMEGVMDMVRAIRNLRSSMNVQAGHRARPKRFCARKAPSGAWPPSPRRSCWATAKNPAKRPSAP